MQRLSGPKAETGVMPRTSYGVVDHQPFGEWTAIVSANRANRENFRSPPREQNLLVSDVAQKLASIGQVGRCDPLREVRAGRLGFSVFHWTRSTCWRVRRSLAQRPMPLEVLG